MRKVLLALIALYQKRWSWRFAGACRYEPSCSEYAREAVERHGVVVGGLLAFARVLRCRPGRPEGRDPVPDRRSVGAALRGGLAPQRGGEEGPCSESCCVGED